METEQNKMDNNADLKQQSTDEQIQYEGGDQGSAEMQSSAMEGSQMDALAFNAQGSSLMQRQ